MAESSFKGTFKIKTFKGEDENEWRIWSSKMLAYATKKGYYDVLTTRMDLTVEATAEKNKEATSDLVIACEGEAWEIIQDMDPANQNAHNMWKALKDIFEPQEIDDYIDLSNQFKKCTMETETENPKKWIRKLQQINRRLSNIAVEHRHSDVEMIAEVFLKLPQSYSEFVTSCNLRGAAGNGTLSNIIKDLDRFYKRTIEDGTGNSKNKNNGREQEQAFATAYEVPRNKNGFVHFSKAFKGLCNKCGKQGHKGVDCRVRPENYVKGHKGQEKNYFKTNNGNFAKKNTQNSDRRNIKCFNCNKLGHFARDCRKEKETMFVGSCDYVGCSYYGQNPLTQEQKNLDQEMFYWNAYVEEKEKASRDQAELLYEAQMQMAMTRSIADAIEESVISSHLLNIELDKENEMENRKRRAICSLEEVENESDSDGLFEDTDSDEWDALSIGSCPNLKMTDVSTVECVYSCAGSYSTDDGVPVLLDQGQTNEEDKKSIAFDVEDRAQIAYLTKRINARQADRKEKTIMTELAADHEWMDSLVW
jgi:hypothetical protein